MTNISFRGKSLFYEDTSDHFNNGLLRLLNISFEDFYDWFLTSDTEDGNIVDKLSSGFFQTKKRKLYKPNISYKAQSHLHGEPGSLWFPIVNDSKHFICKANDSSFAWLTKKVKDKLSTEVMPPSYEENYFEGDPSKDGGYGNYLQQDAWRIEKALTQVNDIKQITGLTSGRCLDLGAGYGYFRYALAQNGFDHDGLEVSKHACDISKKIYGYDSFQGELHSYKLQLGNTYDVITMWDVIEHIADPLDLLKDIYYCLKPGGFLVLKTPNIDCPEVEIFRQYYHSFKREHLIYFAKRSLETYAKKARLIPHFITSKSHLLHGFVGDEQVKSWEAECRGADLIAYFRK